MKPEIHGLPDEVVCQSWPVVVEAWGGVQGRRLLRTYLETQVSRQMSCRVRKVTTVMNVLCF